MQMVSTSAHIDEIRRRRDRKVMSVFRGYAPVWLIAERVFVEEDAVLFNLVFQDPTYGWLSRRYRYDEFNDVLYHMGERRVSEAEMLSIQQQAPPYLEGSGKLQ